MKKTINLFSEVLSGEVKIKVQNRLEYDSIIAIMHLLWDKKPYDLSPYWDGKIEMPSFLTALACFRFAELTIVRHIEHNSVGEKSRSITYAQFLKLIELIKNNKSVINRLNKINQTKYIAERRLLLNFI